MELPIEFAVKLKPGLVLAVRLWSTQCGDATDLKQAASLLTAAAKCVEAWQAQRGSYGTPMPPVRVEELERG